jgi:hypothetical protein
MMNQKRWISAAFAAALVTCFSAMAAASSHSEAPGTASDPETDNTDTWAFVNNGNLVIVAGYNGLWDHAAPNYKKFATEGAIYEIHIVRGASDLADDLKYVFEFSEPSYKYQDPTDLTKGPLDLGGKEFFSQLSGGGAFAQTYKLTKVEKGSTKVLIKGGKVAPPNIGPRTTSAFNALLGGGNLTYEQRWVDGPTTVSQDIGPADGGGKVFVGPRKDAFYVDLGAVFDLAGLPDVAPADPFMGGGLVREQGAQRSSTNYRNIMAITLSIPIATANGKAVTPGAGVDDLVGVWTSASRRQVTVLRNDGSYDTTGPYKQVSRLGLPLINEAVIGLQDKDRWNRKAPKDDVPLFGAYFLNPVIVRDAQGVGLYGAGGTLQAIGCGTEGAGGVIDGKDHPMLGEIKDLRTNRTDIIATINLGYPIPLSATGDVLRVDLSNPDDLLGNAGFSIPTSIAPNRVTENRGAFPNGRRLNLKQEADVTDIEVTLLLCGLPFIVDNSLVGMIGGGAINGGVVGDRVSRIAHDNRATFPYLSEPVAQSDVRASTLPGTGAVCGDGTCAASESNAMCAVDCP